MRSLVLLAAVLLALPLAGCQSGGGNALPATGRVTPTVADGPAPRYGGFQEARTAFSRSSENGVLNATLKDAAWLRFSGDPTAAMAEHRDYFDRGQTSFQVILRPADHVRPTDERFILEDSSGARVAAKPIRYESEMVLVDDRFQFTFDVAFRHGLSADLAWIRLTREADGSSVEWTFR